LQEDIYIDVVDYQPVLSDHQQWPLFKMTENKEAFVKEVILDCNQKLFRKNNTEGLKDILEQTYYNEKIRMKNDPYKIDPQDEKIFWNKIKKTLTGFTTEENADEINLKRNIEAISTRYIREICANFKFKTYELAQKMVPLIIRRVLNSASLKYIGKFYSNKYKLSDRLLYTGAIDEIRNLASKCTLIFVSSHFSNFDNLINGWSIESIGLPPLTYGAGLNLFNSKPIAYYMDKLGAYKLDRRKKNPIYLQALKSYSQKNIEYGIHYLFYPGGTRSRSGALETSFKLGLLSTVIDAQYQNITKNPDAFKKVVIVPLVINYHFVLEAKQLIKQHLTRDGKEKFYTNNEADIKSIGSVINSIFKFAKSNTECAVSFGKPIDVFGNYLNANADSIDKNGNTVPIEDYFYFNGAMESDKQRNKIYTQLLSDKILKEFRKNSIVFSSMVLAFVAFSLIEKANKKLDIYAIIRLPENDTKIPFKIFKGTAANVIELLKEKEKKSRVKLDTILHKSIEEIIEHGLYHLGIYHNKKVLKQTDNGFIACEDLSLLYFYHNRLTGFNLKNAV